jgi:hypothetical protein
VKKLGVMKEEEWLEKKNKEINKTMAREELIEKNTQGDNWAHWHHRRKWPLETLTCDFQKLEISL